MFYLPILLLLFLPSGLTSTLPRIGGAELSNAISDAQAIRNRLVRRANFVDRDEDTEPLEGYNKIRLHESCENQAPNRKPLLEDAFKYGAEYIRSARAWAEELKNIVPADLGNKEKDCTLQEQILDYCPTFTELFSQFYATGADLKRWVDAWIAMSDFLEENRSLQEVVVTCFATIWKDEDQRDLCVHPQGLKVYALTLPPGLAKAPGDAQGLPFDFSGGDFKDTPVINLCNEFWAQKLVHDFAATYNEDDTNTRPNLVTLGTFGVNTWVHELTHIDYTFKAPGGNLDVVDDVSILNLAGDSSKGFSWTWQYAEQNALFAGWAWWTSKKDIVYMSWESPADDARVEKDNSFV